ncbi:MAG: AsnC family transcriptional regulator [Selenomonadaceae bacterium]|nr:AsnC family transcriptional regulator [Selenomonadaceae bacterium]
METLSRQDKEIIKALQEDFPLCEEPYKILAQRAGMSEQDFLQRVRQLVDEKKIRKMGAVLRHREVGFNANALCAWHVPPENLDAIAQVMISNAAVSHCYDRTPAPNWNYNLYTMIHAKTRDECEKIISELSNRSGVTDYKILYTKKEWKKTGMKYFCE